MLPVTMKSLGQAHQRKRSYIIVGRGCAHKLLYFRENTHAGLVSGFKLRFMKVVSDSFQAVFFSPELGFDDTSRDR